jgi:hypothetical protein
MSSVLTVASSIVSDDPRIGSPVIALLIGSRRP